MDKGKVRAKAKTNSRRMLLNFGDSNDGRCLIDNPNSCPTYAWLLTRK